jgi:hypothetical protein
MILSRSIQPAWGQRLIILAVVAALLLAAASAVLVVRWANGAAVSDTEARFKAPKPSDSTPTGGGVLT